MTLRFYQQKAVSDLAHGINQKGPAGRQLQKPKIDERSVTCRHSRVPVRQQRKPQTFLSTKVSMRFHAVQADSQYRCVSLDELAQCALQVARLQCSTWSLIFRIKIQDHPTPAKIRETYQSAVLIRQGKTGR